MNQTVVSEQQGLGHELTTIVTVDNGQPVDGREHIYEIDPFPAGP
ncbi:MAG TPA: hypothetical protein VLD86_01655 [Ilumatobacteraceae bacterium]|nr:hypothetical protein [Ilumatobacteraceae bacterium]